MLVPPRNPAFLFAICFEQFDSFFANCEGGTVSRLQSNDSRGYTYCVARTGVTGTERAMELDRGDRFKNLRDLDAPHPILGFGTSTPEQVRQALRIGAAGMISESEIVKLLEQGLGDAAADLVARMKQAPAPL